MGPQTNDAFGQCNLARVKIQLQFLPRDQRDDSPYKTDRRDEMGPWVVRSVRPKLLGNGFRRVGRRGVQLLFKDEAYDSRAH